MSPSYELLCNIYEHFHYDLFVIERLVAERYCHLLVTAANNRSVNSVTEHRFLLLLQRSKFEFVGTLKLSLRMELTVTQNC
jgi:hypothetical protein